MIDLSKYRIIDLSCEIVPGERRIDGQYLHGKPSSNRATEVQEFIAYGARMHFIQGQTHCGTHVEGRYKYAEEGPDMAGMPLESYIGEAVVCDFSDKKPGETITPGDFHRAGVKSGDIVLSRGNPADRGNAPYFSVEAIDWLIETGIKLLGNENVRLTAPGTPFGKGTGDGKLLLAGIALMDGVLGLEKIEKERVFFIALPLKMQRVSATWTRAIALEEVG